MLDMTFRPLATGHWYEIWNPGLPSHSESFQPASEVSRLMVTNKHNRVEFQMPAQLLCIPFAPSGLPDEFGSPSFPWHAFLAETL